MRWTGKSEPKFSGKGRNNIWKVRFPETDNTSFRRQLRQQGLMKTKLMRAGEFEPIE